MAPRFSRYSGSRAYVADIQAHFLADGCDGQDGNPLFSPCIKSGWAGRARSISYSAPAKMDTANPLSNLTAPLL